MASVTSVTRSIRNAGRVAEITAALVEYGFDDFLIASGLDDLIFRGKRALGMVKKDEEHTRKPQAERVRLVLERLGPTAVKIGQILSTRPDLVPPDWAAEFAKLQDDVPPVDFQTKLRPHIEEQFDKPLDHIFDSIDPQPLAAGSMAQVHRATLKTGEPVVIKVLRPGIAKAIRADMELLAALAELSKDHLTNVGYDPQKVVEEFTRQLNHEMDLRREGRSCERLSEAFKEDPAISFPHVHWEASRGDVLTMEEVKGDRLSRIDADTLPQHERTAIVENGVRAVFHQCFELGFFHADPHPGNLILRGGGKLCFIDCGMTGHIEPKTAELLATLIHAVLKGDVDQVVDCAVKISNADPLLQQDRTFRADVWDFITRFQDVSLQQLRIGDTLDDFFDKLRRHQLQCPSDLIYLIKAITTIEGVGEQLDPTFDIAAYVKPMMERFVRRQHGFRAIRRRVVHNLHNFAELVEDFPEHIRTLMQVFQRNGFTINLEHHGLEDLRRTLDRASLEMSNALLLASVVLASALLLLAGSVNPGGWSETVFTFMGVSGFLIAAAFIVIHFIARRFRSK